MVISKRYSILFKAMATALICLFLVNDIAFGFELKSSAASSALAPPSRFGPISLKWDGINEKYIITVNNELKEETEDWVAFTYLSVLIGQFLHKVKELSDKGLSVRGLDKHLELFKDSIEQQFPYATKKFSRFRFNEMYWDGNVLCLPYERKDSPGIIQTLRYNLPDGKPEEKLPEDTLQANGVLAHYKLHRMEIPIGIGDVKVVLEDPFKDDMPDTPAEDGRASKNRTATNAAIKSELDKMGFSGFYGLPHTITVIEEIDDLTRNIFLQAIAKKREELGVANLYISATVTAEIIRDWITCKAVLSLVKSSSGETLDVQGPNKCTTVSQVTTSKRAKLILQFGLYGEIGYDFGYLSREDNNSSEMPRSFNEYGGIARQRRDSDDDLPIVVFFTVPEDMVNTHNPSQVFLTDKARVSSIPQDLMARILKNGAIGELSHKLQWAGLWLQFDILQKEGKLARIPIEYIDFEKTFKYNVLIKGPKFLESEFGKIVLAKKTRVADIDIMQTVTLAASRDAGAIREGITSAALQNSSKGESAKPVAEAEEPPFIGGSINLNNLKRLVQESTAKDLVTYVKVHGQEDAVRQFLFSDPSKLQQFDVLLPPAASAEELQKTLEYICSFGPRGSGYSADKKTAEYFRARMESCGFSVKEETFVGPFFKDNGSYLETGRERMAAKSYLYSLGTHGRAVEGEMVFADLPTPPKKIACEGKIVILTMRENALKDYFEPDMISLAKKGALGVVVVSPFDSIFVGSVESGSFDTPSRFKIKKESVAEIPVIGIGRSDGKKLRDIFNEAGTANIRITADCVNDNITLSNIIASKKGRKDPDKKIVIIGHRDTVGNIGANDNGSGLAVMLELGRRLKDTDNDITREFVSSCGEEELGSLGGKDYVERHKGELGNIVALIEVDMVGGDTLMAVSEGNWPDLPGPIRYDERLNRLLHAIAERRGIGLESGACSLGTPDSGRFAMVGVPSVWLWSPDSKFYHTDEDMFNKVNVRTLANAVDLLQDFIERAAILPPAPRVSATGTSSFISVQTNGLSEELAFQNTTDIKNALEALTKRIPGQVKQNEDSYYTVRYNTTKIPQGSLAEALLKVYVNELMPLWIVGKDRIKLTPSGAADQSLMSIECYKDRSRSEDMKIGEGRVDIGEDINGKALRIIGMMNMALVASHIPNNVSPEDLRTKYDSLVSFIARQYKEISGEDLDNSFWQDISKGICIILPHAAPVPLEEVDDYYRLTIAQLQQAA